MRKTALLTGINGQDSSYLAELLLDKGYIVHGTMRRTSNFPSNLKNILHIKDRLQLHFADLGNEHHICALIDKIKPSEVYHLAAQSDVRVSFDIPEYTVDTNGLGTLRILEAIRNFSPDSRVYFAATSELYGSAKPPQNENTLMIPNSPYGAAKCVTEHTQIYTENGLKKIKNIEIDDKVWTHTGQLQKVTNVFVRQYKGELINICPKNASSSLQSNINLTVTPEHPLLTKRGWIPASELTLDDEISIIATHCKICEKMIPSGSQFCSNTCRMEWLLANTDYSSRQAERSRQNIRKFNQFQTPKAKENHHKGIAKWLKQKGMSSQEYYINLLLNECTPGFFDYTGDGSFSIDGLFPDWTNKNKKVVIELFYWNVSVERMEEKRIRYEKQGYKMITISPNDFDNPWKIKRDVAKFVSNLGSLEYLFVPIKHITRYTRKASKKVFNLEVEKDNSFIAGGIVVHNCLAYNLCRIYRKSYDMFVACGILFNHESERRGENFVTRKITKAVNEIVRGERKELFLGNMDAKRDWGYAPDYVRAMWMMLQEEEPDDYVIGTGEAHTIREFVEEAFSYAGLDWEKYVKIDPSLYRPVEVNYLLADASKATNKLGWYPRVIFKELVKIMMEADKK